MQEAVEEIITRAVGETRKTAFGDDTDDTKGKAWTREQAWKVIKVLSTKLEVRVSYQILMYTNKIHIFSRSLTLTFSWTSLSKGTKMPCEEWKTQS
jgi:hypothetical protein